MPHRVIALALVASVVAPLSGGWMSPAAAECAYALVYVTREGEAPVYVLGPDPCVTPTPWYQDVTIGPTTFHQSGLGPGTPNGFYVELRPPAP